MCGRFTQHYSWKEVHQFLNVFGAPRNLRARYNIAPTTEVDVIRHAKDGNELVRMRWGLAPAFWKKTLKELPATFNARAETVAEKPMFRGAYQKRRCIIPASGFYEWTGPKGDKQPHFFTAGDGSPILAFAGLWESWHDEAAGEDVLSCTIVVTDASEWMREYHDRMPVLLTPPDIDGWLNGTLRVEQLRPAGAASLREWPVDRRVNKAGEADDDMSLIAKIA